MEIEYEDLLLEKKGGIATITLNVPEKLNAYTQRMQRSLNSAVDEIAKDDEMRVVILTGAGRGFCAGANVSAMGSRTGPDEPAQIPRYIKLQGGIRPYFDVLPRLNKPVIAAINGPCAGGGFAIAMSCDIRIASEAATFLVAQVARAIVPDMGLTYYLPLAIGLSRALELMFTAEKIGAAEAERLGIVSRVVSPDDLMKVTRKLATRIIQQAPLAIELTKRIMWQSQFDALYRQLEAELTAQQICSPSDDHRESVRAFLEKRQPQFKGR